MQHLLFVDPKSLRSLSLSNPKLNFYQTTQEIQARPNLQATNPNLRLHTFLVTATRLADLEHLGADTAADLAERHILLQEECKDTYTETMFKRVLAAK